VRDAGWVRRRAQRNLTCAYEAHIGIGRSVATSVPKRGPWTIIRQPTSAKFPMKNGPEIVDFRPVLEFSAALANRRLQPLGHLTLRPTPTLNAVSLAQGGPRRES
jgi:hypothetical protein